MRTHIFGAGPNTGPDATYGDHWERFRTWQAPQGAVAYGADRAWNTGLGAECPVCKAGRRGTLLGRSTADPYVCDACKLAGAGVRLEVCPRCPEHTLYKVGAGEGDPRLRKALGQKRPPPPGICCQRTPDGGVICSDGTGFPPG